MKVVVVGGTGLIGSKVVAMLTERGHQAVPATPKLGINTITGEGLADALRGASVVVDVSNSPNFEYETALQFFATSTQHLLTAEATAGIGHHVALSVVGTRVLSESGDLAASTAGYFLAKRIEEALIQISGLPYSIVHATQFYEFIKGIADDSTRDGAVRLAPVLFQPMAAQDVAAAVCRIALGPPVNGVVEVGGPERSTLDQVVREVLAATGDPRQVVTDAAAGYFGITVSEQALVPAESARRGDIRLGDWLRQSAGAMAQA